MGRPTRYRQDLADAICDGMAGGRNSMDVCRELGLPKQTVGHWRADHPEFRTAYINAFMARCYGMAEEALAVLDEVPKGADMATVTLARAKSDLFKFFASRAVPHFHERAALLGEGSIVVVQLPDNGRGRLIEGHAEDVTEPGHVG